MATKSVPELKVPEKEDKDLEEVMSELNGLVVLAQQKKPDYTGPYVDVILPRLEGDDDSKVDQYEHVTIANENKEYIYRVLRGVHVEVPVPVFVALKQKHPNL